MRRHAKALSTGSNSGLGMRRGLFGAICLCVLGLAAFLGSGASSAAAVGCPNDAQRIGPSANLPDCRAFELVSPAYKTFGIGVGFTYLGIPDIADSGVAAYEGERFAAKGHYGSTLVDGGVSLVTSWAFAERTPNGWVSHNPMTHPLYGPRVTRFPGLFDRERLSLPGDLDQPGGRPCRSFRRWSTAEATICTGSRIRATSAIGRAVGSCSGGRWRLSDKERTGRR